MSTQELRMGSEVQTQYGPGYVAKDLGDAYLIRLNGPSNPFCIRIRKNGLEISHREKHETEETGESQRKTRIKKAGARRESKKKSSKSTPDRRQQGETPFAISSYSSCLQTIEALRFGLVPGYGLNEMTLEYDQLEEWIKKRMGQIETGCGVSEIYGPFGTGKSHTMAVIREYAYQHNYVVAQVEVDGRTVSLSQPKTFLASLYSTLRAKNLDQTSPVLDLYLQSIAKNRNGVKFKQYSGFKRTESNYWNIMELDNMYSLDHITSELESMLSCSGEYNSGDVKNAIKYCYDLDYWDVHLKTPIGRKIDEQPANFIDNIVGMSLISKGAGYNGLILTIDEFEVEYHLSYKMASRVDNLISELADFLKAQRKPRGVPLAFFFATIGEDYHRGDKFVNRLIEAGNGDVYELDSWNPRQRAKLAHRIHNFYCNAYGCEYSFSDAIVNEVEKSLKDNAEEESGMIRAFIKRYVARLDREYGPPANGV